MTSKIFALGLPPYQSMSGKYLPSLMLQSNSLSPYLRRVSKGNGEEVLIVTFPPGDPEYPRNWHWVRKWLIIGPILLIDLSVSWGASGYSPAEKNFQQDMGVSSGTATLGLSLYVLGLALGPMTLAPLSEVCIQWSSFQIISITVNNYLIS